MNEKKGNRVFQPRIRQSNLCGERRLFNLADDDVVSSILGTFVSTNVGII